MTTDQEQIIITYLQDEAKLYQDWYQTLSPKGDSTMRQVAKPPSLPELRVMCQNWSQRWFERNQQLLQKAFSSVPLTSVNEFCEKWKKAREHHHFHEWKDIIVAFTVVLASTDAFHPNHLQVVAATLVTVGVLDWFCGDKDPRNPQPAWVW